MIDPDGKCTAIRCNKPATMTLDLKVVREKDENHQGYEFEQEIPYCDECLGWFYRSFSRKSYHTTIRGVTILVDLDEEFGHLDYT
jgi:hypothetical protein